MFLNIELLDDYKLIVKDTLTDKSSNFLNQKKGDDIRMFKQCKFYSAIIYTVEDLFLALLDAVFFDKNSEVTISIANQSCGAVDKEDKDEHDEDDKVEQDNEDKDEQDNEDKAEQDEDKDEQDNNKDEVTQSQGKLFLYSGLTNPAAKDANNFSSFLKDNEYIFVINTTCNVLNCKSHKGSKGTDSDFSNVLSTVRCWYETTITFDLISNFFKNLNLFSTTTISFQENGDFEIEDKFNNLLSTKVNQKTGQEIYMIGNILLDIDVDEKYKTFNANHLNSIKIKHMKDIELLFSRALYYKSKRIVVQIILSNCKANVNQKKNLPKRINNDEDLSFIANLFDGIKQKQK